MLAAAGYSTAAFVSATPLKRRTGIAAGFTEFDQPKGAARRARVPTTRALSWLAEEPSEPFFLWVHYWDPHDPYRPPAEYKGRFSHTEPGLEEYFAEGGYVSRPRWNAARHNSRYDEEVLYTDSEIGRLLDGLRGRPDWDELAIVFTADHGEGLGQRNWRDHGRIYSGQLYVPLILRLPEGPRGLRVAEPVSPIDIVPTLVGALELPVSEAVRAQFQGVDLLAARPDRRILSERAHRERAWEPGSRYALTGQRWRYVHSPEAGDELFDLSVDRWEKNNVIAEHPELAERLKSELLAARAAAAVGPALEQLDEVPPELAKELEALGYVD